jgi:hypothetical protein
MGKGVIYMIKKSLVIIFLLGIFLLSKVSSFAAEVEFFDSTDHYLGGCQLTNKSEWEVKEEVLVTKFEVWYNWSQGESVLPVKIFLNGEEFAEFEATRSACDPYQKQWCNADYQINKLFPVGKYTTEIPNSRQCLKPGGTGAIRLYKEDNSTPIVQPSPTATIQKEVVVTPTPMITSSSNTCACNQTTIIASAAAISLVGSTLISLLLRRK